jgi:hypothetical protein
MNNCTAEEKLFSIHVNMDLISDVSENFLFSNLEDGDGERL